MGHTETAHLESYILSLLAEGKHEAAFAAIPEFGSPALYAPHFANLGFRLWRAGRSSDAVAVLRRATRLDPELASAWQTLGLIHLSEGELHAGDRCLARAISLEPDAAAAHYLRGIVAKHSGRTAAAAGHLTRCLALRPSHREAAAELRALLSAAPSSAPVLREAEQALARAEEASPDTPARATLSLCLIARDEERSLPRCLASFRSVADQIVVVDTGSTDRTAEAARALGAEMHHFPWCDDFAAARNAAIARATCDWVLIADADEELPPESADQLRELLSSPIPGSVCHLTTHAPDAHLRPSGGGFVAHPRLFRNGEGIHFEGAVHEQLADGHGRPIQDVIFTGIPVLHHGYLEPEPELAERGERNLRLLAARAAAEPGNPAVLFYLGTAQLGLGRTAEAVDILSRALDLADPDRAFRVKAAVLLAHALRLLSRQDESEQVLRAALLTDPDHPELLCSLGHHLERLNRPDDAIAAYQSAARGRFGPMLDYHDFTCRDVQPLSRIAAIHLARGDSAAAAAEACKALAIRPDAPEPRHLLAAALLDRRRYRQAQRQLRIILAANPQDNCAHNAFGVSLALQGDHEAAVQAFELALAHEPDDLDAICNLALSRHALGDFPRARDAWEDALKHSPSHVPAWLGLARTYLRTGAYQAGARCYEMAALHSGYAPDVISEIAATRSALSRMAGRAAPEEQIL